MMQEFFLYLYYFLILLLCFICEFYLLNLIKKNSREKINEEKMKNLVRKGLKGKINNRKVKNKKDFKKCEKFIDKI